jgi:ABC-type transporter Mla subunit MlaD
MCERDSTQLQRAYRGEYNKYLFFNGLKIFLAAQQFFACIFIFATAQRTGLSGILS